MEWQVQWQDKELQGRRTEGEVEVKACASARHLSAEWERDGEERTLRGRTCP